METTHSTWRRKKTECEICGKVMTNPSLQRHMEQQHASVKKKDVAREIEEGREDIIASCRKGKRNLCPVAGCDGGGKDKFCMYRHFCLRHSSLTLVITEDGRLPKCNVCGMHVHK